MHHIELGGRMKLTSRKLRKLISEAVLKEMASFAGIGSSMTNLLETYVIPYKDRIRFEIEDDGYSITVNMYLINNLKEKISERKVLIGFIAADFVGDMCADCYIVGLSATAGGENMKQAGVASFRNDLIDDDLFKYGSYGPILYELCLETVSKKENTYLTCDKNSLQPAAYNVWAYYLLGRPDVIKYQLDPMRVPREFRITPDNPKDDCDTGDPPTNDTAEEFYMTKTSRLVHPQGPGDDPKGMYKAYTDYLQLEDPIMKGYRKESTPFLDLIASFGMIL